MEETISWCANSSVPTEATEMLQSIKYEDKREVFGFKVHSFSTFEKIKKYDETDNAESAEKPYFMGVLEDGKYLIRS